MLTFLIAVGILVWQSQSTFATFFSFRTTVSISQETSERLPSPTVVLCQEHKWDNGQFPTTEVKTNFSDEDWVLKQFFQLNEKMNISLKFHGFMKPENLEAANAGARTDWIQLNTGNNSIYINGVKSRFIVKEILNPWNGLCYAIIPDSSLSMKKKDMIMATIGFSQEIENPILSAYLIHSNDWYGFIVPYFGNMMPFKIPLKEFRTFTGIQIEQRKYFRLQENFYLPSSMTKCKNYALEDQEGSYLKCLVKSHIHFFEILASDYDCSCIPSTYKSFFEIQPTSLDWDECKTQSEHMKCSAVMDSMFGMDQEELASICPTPCMKIDYKGKIFEINGGYAYFKNDNEIALQISFSTMASEIHNEMLIFDLANFIGTAGGSLGLFIGFSFTGFVSQMLDFFMRD